LLIEQDWRDTDSIYSGFKKVPAEIIWQNIPMATGKAIYLVTPA